MVTPAGDFVASVLAVLRRLEGHFTLVFLNADEPGTIVAARRSTPLVLGVGDGEMFIGSDVAAFIQYTRDAIELGQDQAVVITADGYRMLYPIDSWTIGHSFVPKSIEQCHQYGGKVAQRFRDLPNIMWMSGGDYSSASEDPARGSDVDHCIDAMMRGIREACGRPRSFRRRRYADGRCGPWACREWPSECAPPRSARSALPGRWRTARLQGWQVARHGGAPSECRGR